MPNLVHWMTWIESWRELLGKSYYFLSQSDQDNVVSMVPNKSDLKTFISWFPNYRKKFQIPISGSNISWGRGIDGNGQSGGLGGSGVGSRKNAMVKKKDKRSSFVDGKVDSPVKALIKKKGEK